MVDAIRMTGPARTAPATPVTAAREPATGTPPPPTAPADGRPSISSVARAMAAAPPVDKERVLQIKRAIQNGTFPILPATIADRLLALKLEWTGREPR